MRELYPIEIFPDGQVLSRQKIEGAWLGALYVSRAKEKGSAHLELSLIFNLMELIKMGFLTSLSVVRLKSLRRHASGYV